MLESKCVLYCVSFYVSFLESFLHSNVYFKKSLLVANHRAKGRNNQGRITTRHKGGGHKRRYRLIDFKRNKYGLQGTVASIEYDISNL